MTFNLYQFYGGNKAALIKKLRRLNDEAWGAGGHKDRSRLAHGIAEAFLAYVNDPEVEAAYPLEIAT